MNPEYFSIIESNIIKPESTYMDEVREKTHRQIMYVCGLPSGGKSSVIKPLAVTLHAQIIPEFLDKTIYQHIRDHTNLDQQRLAQKLTLEQHIQKNALVKTFSENEKIVVERGSIDSVAYALVNSPGIIDELIREIQATTWEPALYLILIANPTTLKQRHMQRYGLSEHEWNPDRDEFIQKLHNAYTNLAVHLAIPLIDTTKLTVEETVEKTQNLFIQHFEYAF